MSPILLSLLIKATGETCYMVLLSGFIAMVFGLPLGIFLYLSRKGNLAQNKFIHFSLSTLINVTRSIPFIILMVFLIPFTRFLVHTSIGTSAAIVPLSIAAIPFVARLIDNAFSEISSGLLGTGLAMGGNSFQIVTQILIQESLPNIVNGISLMLINLIAYSAMAGAIGGGGLGDIAIRYGYQRFDTQMMLATILIIILLVQVIQFMGDYFYKSISKKRGM